IILNDNSAGPDGRLYKFPIMAGLTDLREVPLNFIRTRDDGMYSDFAISLFARGTMFEKDGHFVMPVKSYIGDVDDYFAFYYDLSFGPTDPSKGHWNPNYSTYRAGSRYD